MKTIIAGCRHLSGIGLVELAVKLSGFEISEVVSGKEPYGIDASGELWAKFYGVPIKEFWPNWKDFSKPCFIKVNSRGEKYNALAGFKRNKKMARYADALVAIWDGKSKGTRNMIKAAERRKLAVYIYRIDQEREKPAPRPIKVIKQGQTQRT